MVIKIKEQSASRLVIETWSSTVADSLFYFIAIVPLLLVLFISIWLYIVSSPIAEVCLGLSSIFLILCLILFIDDIRQKIKAKPMTTSIDVEAGLATVTEDLHLAIPKWTTELKLDSVQSIELTWDDPRYDDVQLALRGLDGSYLLVSYGSRTELTALAQQVQRLLNKPIKDEEIKSNSFRNSRTQIHEIY